MKQEIARSLFWLVWSSGGIQLLSLLSALWVARLLDPSDYGLMALAAMFTSTMNLLTEMGIGAAIIQFRDLQRAHLNVFFWMMCSVGVLAYISIFGLSPFLEAWFDTPRLTSVLRVAGLAVPIVAIRVVPDSLLRKRIALDKTSKAELIAKFIAVPIVLTLALGGAGVWALVAGALVTPTAQCIIVFSYARWFPGIHMTRSRIVEMFKYSFATFGTRFSWALYNQADTFVLGKLQGESVLGFYSMGKHLASLPITRVSLLARQILSPVMAQLQDNRSEIRFAFFRATRLVSLVTFPSCVALAITAEDLVALTLTAKWLPAVPLIQILCAYTLIKSVDALFPPVLMARYRAAYLFRYTTTLLFVMPCAFWVGGKVLGANGVALAWLIVYPIPMARMGTAALREMNSSWRSLLRELQTPLAATSGMAACFILCRLAIQTCGVHSPLLLLLIPGLAAAFSFVAIVHRNISLWVDVKLAVSCLFRADVSLQSAK